MKILKAFQLNHAAPGRIAGAPSAAVFMAAALFLACPLTVHADDPSRLIPGTTINGVNVSDQTVDGAAALLQDAFGHWGLVLKGRNGVSWEITGNEIGFRAVVDQRDGRGRNRCSEPRCPGRLAEELGILLFNDGYGTDLPLP